MKKNKIFLLSGGLDSSTMLFDFLNKNPQEQKNICACFVNYCQKTSKIEGRQSKKIAKKAGVPLLTLNFPLYFIKSSLLNNLKKDRGDNLPLSFIPARNSILLSLLSAVFYDSIESLFIGVNSLDFSGYPDCRPEFIEAKAKELSLALGKEIKINAPFQEFSKKDIFNVLFSLKEKDFLLNKTNSCYEKRGKKHNWGYGCGKCDSCLLRIKGFEEAINGKQ